MNNVVTIDQFFEGFHYLTHNLANPLPFSDDVKSAITGIYQKNFEPALSILPNYRHEHWIIEFYYLLARQKVCAEGEYRGLAQEFWQLNQQFPNLAIAYEAARCLILAGDGQATNLFVSLLNAKNFPRDRLQQIIQYPKELQFINDLLIQNNARPLPNFDAHYNQRIARILAPDKLLGRAESAISPAQERIIHDLLSEKWRLWEGGQTAKPKFLNDYAVRTPAKN